MRIVPPAATVYVVTQVAASVTEAKFLRMEDGAAAFENGSGDYVFESRLP